MKSGVKMGRILGIMLTIIGGAIAFALLFGFILVLILMNFNSGYYFGADLLPIYIVEILIMIIGFILFIYGINTIKRSK